MAIDKVKSKVVAIKKITAPFKSSEMARRCLRELNLLSTLKHPNVIGLLDVFLLGQNPDLYRSRIFRSMNNVSLLVVIL